VGGNYFFHDPMRQKAFYKTLLLQKASHSLDLLNWFMGSTPVKVYGIGGLDFYGRMESPELRCSQCNKASKCPYHIEKPLFTMDYGEDVEIKDYCVWNRTLDLNDNSELCISYANGGKATFHECHFTPEYSREYWLVGERGKLYGYYDNKGRFLVRLEHAQANERFTEEYKPEHTGGAHGGGDKNLRQEFYRRIIAREPALDMLESAYYSTALAICAETSIETGQPVVIPALAVL
jgi:predicted dehydrogenase